MTTWKTSFSFYLACGALTLALAMFAPAQTFTVVAEFEGTNGSLPSGALVQATDGNFYGVTFAGGAYEKGTIFQLTPAGQLTSIHNFCAQANCSDGYEPEPLIFASDGNLYGVTRAGGSANGGVFYRVTLDGAFTALYSFCTTSACLDGGAPSAIIQANDGNFYGTTPVRGKFGQGTLFRLTPTGALHVLYSFCSLKNCLDGSYPYGPPLQGINGSFYGGTISGGSGSGGFAQGVVYEFSPGKPYHVLQSFCYGALDACPLGSEPAAPLVQDADGDIFATTLYGGSYNSGTAFEIPSSGSTKVLHTFHFNGWVDPASGLILATDGNLYGVGTDNDWDNLNGYSNIFQITPAGEYTSLYSSYNSLGGPLLEGTDGNLYGPTAFSAGNNAGYGTIFKFSNGLKPLVKTVSSSGKVGQTVLILGNGLTGSTSVTFNGVAAAFTVESDTYIKATVPAGATTGTVSVVTSTGTLNSNPQFVVTK